MTLDRKDYKSAIPQLEKRISQIEQVGEKGLANFDVLKASLEKEIRTRTQALLKTNERVEYAIESADGKNTIYHSASTPTGGEYKIGDTWFDASNGYAIHTWNGTSWVKEELGEDAIANLAITNAKIANGTIQSAKIGTLDAGKITSGDIASARLQTNVVSAINATVNQIDAKNIKASQITIGESQVTNLSTDLSNRPTTSTVNSAIATAKADAEKVATNYLTTISGTTGISVHSANDTSNFANINSNGMTVYKGGVDVASFGDTARIGEETAYHTVVESDSFSILNGDEDVFTVDSNGGSRTEVRTKFSLHEKRLQRSGNYETTRSVTFTAGREYTFKLYTSTTQTVTKTFPQTGSTSFSLTGTLNGSTNTITFTPLYSSQGRVKFRMVRTVTVSSGYANCATFEATYNITADIPMLNIGGITYTDIGRVIKGGYEAQPSIADISASANTSYTLGSVDLDAGVWVVAVRARFTPSASGAHVSQITISNNSTPTNTALDRLYAESTYFNQHNATFVVMPANDEPLTYYVHGTATVAGTWNRTSDPAFSIRAVKIR